MDNLKSKNLLLIAPHYKVFIKDQASYIKPFLTNMIILTPVPHFSKVITYLPYFKEKFDFLKSIINTEMDKKQGELKLSPKYLALPVDYFRKRNILFALNSSINMLLKKKINFDFIHSHFIDYSFIGVNIKNKFKKPLVVTAHGGDIYTLPFINDYYRILTKYILDNTDQIITVSKFNEEKILQLGVSAKKINLIPNGFDETIFKPILKIQARKQLNLPNKTILMSIGNLIEIKGHIVLIESVKNIMHNRNDILLIIIGSGPMKNLLENKIKRLGLDKKILLLGNKKHEEIPIWINACDLFILPSFSEGFPTVIPEALACGKPVVSTNVGGVSEIINKEVGILVEPQNSNSLEKGILKALNEQWHPQIIKDYAHQYSWNQLAPKIISVYNKL